MSLPLPPKNPLGQQKDKPKLQTNNNIFTCFKLACHIYIGPWVHKNSKFSARMTAIASKQVLLQNTVTN